MSKMEERISHDNHILNVLLIALCWACTLTISTAISTIGPLSAKSIGADDYLATFTIGTFSMGSAISALCSGHIFKYIGRRLGFLVGAGCQMTGALLGVLSIRGETVFLLLIGCAFIGFGQGVGNFLRFCASESVPRKQKSKAITYVMTGGILAAILGPLGAEGSENWLPDHDFMGSYLMLMIIITIDIFLLMLVSFPKSEVPAIRSEADLEVMNDIIPKRSIKTIISQPIFIVSVLISTFSQTIMVVLMSSVTLAITEQYHYSFKAAATVILLHLLAMFMPGIYTGSMIGRYGAIRVGLVGCVLSFISLICLLFATDIYWFATGMIFCGVSWNCGFSSGSVLVLSAYSPEENVGPIIQSIHDFCFLVIAGTGALISGLVYTSYGWSAIVLMGAVLLFVNVITILYAFKIRKTLVDLKSKDRSVSMTDDQRWAQDDANEGRVRHSSIIDISFDFEEFESIREATLSADGAVTSPMRFDVSAAAPDSSSVTQTLSQQQSIND